MLEKELDIEALYLAEYEKNFGEKYKTSKLTNKFVKESASYFKYLDKLEAKCEHDESIDWKKYCLLESNRIVSYMLEKLRFFKLGVYMFVLGAIGLIIRSLVFGESFITDEVFNFADTIELVFILMICLGFYHLAGSAKARIVYKSRRLQKDDAVDFFLRECRLEIKHKIMKDEALEHLEQKKENFTKTLESE